VLLNLLVLAPGPKRMSMGSTGHAVGTATAYLFSTAVHVEGGPSTCGPAVRHWHER
jgi:putative effector of murein hydrolase